MHYPVIFLLKTWAFILWLLPRQVFIFFGNLLGILLRLSGFRSRIIRENLKRVFPHKTEAEREVLLGKNYIHYGVLFLEFIRSFWSYSSFMDNYCEVIGGEHLVNAQKKGKGVLVFTAHIGNWELLPACGAYVLKQPVTMVTKHLKPEWLHQFIAHERESIGVKMAFEPRTMQTVLRALNKNEIVGFVMDQYMGAPFAARVPFFGIPVGSQIALATIALRVGSPVIPASVYRNAAGKYVVKFEPEMELLESSGDRDMSIIENTAKYVKKTEEWILQNPEQWLWIHRRWKGNLDPLPPNSLGELVK